MHAMTQATTPTTLHAQQHLGEMTNERGLIESLSAEGALLLAEARNRAFAEVARGHLDLGLSVLHEALSHEPMAHDLLSDMAALLLSAGKLAEAQAAAERALLLQPAHGASLYTLAFALSGQGQVLRGKEALELLLQGPALSNLMDEAPELAEIARIELARLDALLDSANR
ncbi:hypothetical protein DBR47_18025 [Paucibacter sp. KBW04]|nr:hypothetical protein DBR47_18025 [Paucibacter sp. KBW04]